MADFAAIFSRSQPLHREIATPLTFEIVAACQMGIALLLGVGGIAIWQQMNKISSWRGTGKAAAHYVAILQPLDIGEWRVVFPDLPDCETHGFTLHDATFAAETALAQCAANQGAGFPRPRDLRQIEDDTEWLSKNSVVLNKAVVSLVPLRIRLEIALPPIDDPPPEHRRSIRRGRRPRRAFLRSPRSPAF